MDSLPLLAVLGLFILIIIIKNYGNRLRILEDKVEQLLTGVAVAPQRAAEPRQTTQTSPLREAASPVFTPHLTPKTAPPLPKTPPPAARPPARAIDWEKIIGVKLFSWVAGLALLIAAIFFMGYSIEQGWLSPPVRMTMGIVLAIILLALCEWRFAKRYPVTANALDASAIGILFATFYASHSLWNLIPLSITFALMALTTAVAVVLSVRRESRFTALLGLLGGFATPAVLSTGENHPITLFGYLMLLNIGLAWVAQRRRWGFLVVLCLILTTLYQWAWVFTFLTLSQLPLAMGIFLIFPLAAFAVMAFGRRFWRGEFTAHKRSFSGSAILPFLFALFVAATPQYAEHFELLFGFLFCLSVGLGIVAWKQGSSFLHYIGGISTLFTFGIWLNTSYTPAAWPWISAIYAAFVVCYALIPSSLAFMTGSRYTTVTGRVTASLLLFVPSFLAAIEPGTSNPLLFFGPLMALLALITTIALRTASVMQYFIAVFMATIATWVWSSHFSATTPLGTVLLIYLFFSLPYLAVPVIATRMRQQHFEGSAHCALVGFISLIFFAVPHLTTAATPLPLLAAWAVITLGVGITAFALSSESLMIGGVTLAGITLICWTMRITSAPWALTSAICGTAVTGMALIWHGFARRRKTAPSSLFATATIIAGALAQINNVLAITSQTPISWEYWLALQTAVLIMWFVLAVTTGWFELTVAAVATTACVFEYWIQPTSPPITLVFGVGTFLYLLFIIYPLVLGRRVAQKRSPFVAAIFASALYFFFAKYRFAKLGWDGFIGALPVAQAALLSTHLGRLLRMDPPNQRHLGRLALVAGSVLAFITVAIPLQLDKQWITLGWALEGAALAMLYLKIPHKGLLWWSTALLMAAFVRLSINQEVLSYYPRSATPILNWYLYTYLVAASGLITAGVTLRKCADTLFGNLRASTLCLSGGVILLFLLLNVEIADYYSTGETLTFNFSSTLAQDLSYTLGWGLFAVVLLTAGIFTRNKPARLVAILLLTVAVIKGFLHDLWRLGGLYRVGTFVGLAICLTLVALALQRFVFKKSEGDSK